ncbi:GPW/gp25 family protein [Paenibacillus spiritus]|nr:GPW/gp25 family protein [Paenibacillus spiritus]
MTTMSIDMTQPSGIDFAPSSRAAEIRQNIRTILSTPLGSVPMQRGVGLDVEVLDQPLAVAQARMASSVLSAIAEQEPRAKVTAVEFIQTDEASAMWGTLRPVVHIQFEEEVSE